MPGKNTISVSTNFIFFLCLWMLEPVTFIAPLGTWKMDVENPNFKPNDDGDEEDDDDVDDDDGGDAA